MRWKGNDVLKLRTATATARGVVQAGRHGRSAVSGSFELGHACAAQPCSCARRYGSEEKARLFPRSSRRRPGVGDRWFWTFVVDLGPICLPSGHFVSKSARTALLCSLLVFDALFGGEAAESWPHGRIQLSDTNVQ